MVTAHRYFVETITESHDIKRVNSFSVCKLEPLNTLYLRICKLVKKYAMSYLSSAKPWPGGA